jgi:2-polyprenyl-6-methoxyphenol hydroxylase-like FAD-dependent oxidoreductase
MPTQAEIKTSVVSRDGTQIAYWTSGCGPPLVLVQGAPADHTRWRPLLPYLEPHVTVHALDRRGRGASTDTPAYRLERDRAGHLDQGRMTEPGDVADLLAAYENWHPQVRAILEAFDETFRWAERSPMPRSMGRVGDACHATLPFLAQGAAQAMEDGVTLATLLSDLGSPAAVPLRVYESVRRPRVTRVQRMASDNKARLLDGLAQRGARCRTRQRNHRHLLLRMGVALPTRSRGGPHADPRTTLHRNRNRDPA